MADAANEPVEESPATWENVLVGKVKEAIGHAAHNEKLTEEGEEQEEIAHDVREEYSEEHEH